MMDKMFTCIALMRRLFPVLACLLALFLAAAPAMAAATNVIGEVTRVIGSASVVRGELSSPINAGSTVHAGDDLRTSANSRLAVQFDDGTRLMLGADSRITLDRYVYDPDSGKGSAVIDVVARLFPTDQWRFEQGQSERAECEDAACNPWHPRHRFLG